MNRAAQSFAESMGLLSLLCLAMFACRVLATDTTRYSFIPGNLALAWAGLLFGWLLARNLKKMRWLSWQNLVLTGAWVVFLPNTWYTLTDFLHVYATGEISELYDIVLIGAMVLTSFSLGLVSLYIVHKELAKRLDETYVWSIIELVILISSFAIYLGRIERWSSWDVLTNTSGIVISASDRVINPLANLHAWNVTGLFFVTLSVLYFAFWRTVSALRPGRTDR